MQIKMTEKQKILVLEDEVPTALELEELLKNNDYEVYLAHTWQDALYSFENDSFDLVLSDINLESNNMDGIEVAKEIQKKANAPIIFVTNYSEPLYLRRAFEVNPDNYIVKPYQEQDLLVKIKLALSRKYNHTDNNHDFVLLKDGSRQEKITLDEIILLKADGAFCYVITLYSIFYLSKNLKNTWAEMPTGNLKRIHNSFVINYEKINAIEKNAALIYKRKHDFEEEVWQKLVELTNDSILRKNVDKVKEIRIPISNSYKDDFKDLF